MAQIELSNGSFDDIDAWCEMATGWDVRFQQLDRGSLSADMSRVETPGLLLQEVTVSRRMHQSGCAPDGLLTFGLPLEPHMHRCFGRELGATSVLNFGRSGGYESVSEPLFNGQTVSVERASFLEECRAVSGSGGALQLVLQGEAFAISQKHRNRLLTLGSALLRCARGNQLEQQGASELAADIRYQLALALSYGQPHTAPLSRAARHHALDRALEIIHAYEGQVVIPEVCRYAAASARSLSRAFRERFGVSTKQYMVAVRLSGVRRELKQGRANVTGAAGQFGFWHLGQFSADYRDMFGELPSQTLKNSQPVPAL